MSTRPLRNAEPAGLLIRLWFEPDAEPDTAIRGRLLAISRTGEPVEFAACAGERALSDAVRQWLSAESVTLRGASPPVEPAS